MNGLNTAAAAASSIEQNTRAQNANVAMLHNAYKRWSDSKGADLDCWRAISAEGIKFGSLSAGAAHVANMSGGGPESVRAFFENVAKHWSLLSFHTDEFIANDNAVVMRGRVTWQNKRTGKVFSSAKMDYWRFCDGKAVEFFEVCDTAGIQAAASG
jgi:ketosteroid isomerase-like protein